MMMAALRSCFFRGQKPWVLPLRSFSKVVDQPSSKANELKRLVDLTRGERGRLAGAVGLLVISSGVTMSVPFALGRVIDIIYSMDQMKSFKSKEEEKETIRNNLRKVCGILVGVFTMGALANFGRVYLMRLVSQNVTAKVRRMVFSSITRQEVAYFDRTKTGELINRLSSDSLVVSQAISTQVSDGLRSTFMTAAGVGMMFYMSPQLAFVSLGVVPPVALWGVWMGRQVRTASRGVQDALAQSTQVAEERISNIRTVRAFATEAREMNRYNKEMENVLSASQREALVQAQFYGIVRMTAP